MIHAYAFMLEGALGTLRVQASGRDVGADHTIAAVHKEVDDNLLWFSTEMGPLPNWS